MGGEGRGGDTQHIHIIVYIYIYIIFLNEHHRKIVQASLLEALQLTFKAFGSVTIKTCTAMRPRAIIIVVIKVMIVSH